MSILYLEPWLTLGLALVFLVELALLGHFPDWRPTPPPTKHRSPRPLRPRTPDDCPLCRESRATPANRKAVAPYAQRKSPCGPLREKTIDTQGYACPHPDCACFQVTDATVHALIGYGHHPVVCPAPCPRAKPAGVSRTGRYAGRASGGRHESIRDFFCQACQRKVTARRDTPLYRLKAASDRVAQALQAVAEGLSTRATACVFSISETTLRGWLTRAGQHSRNLHERFLHALHLTHVQLDEIRLKLYGAAEAKWLPSRPAATSGPPRRSRGRVPQAETTGWFASDTCTALARPGHPRRRRRRTGCSASAGVPAPSLFRPSPSARTLKGLPINSSMMSLSI